MSVETITVETVTVGTSGTPETVEVAIGTSTDTVTVGITGPQGATGAGGATALDDLTDVTITSPADGAALVYNSGSSTWVDGTVSTVGALDDLTDVTLTTPATGAALVYNGSVWVDGPIDLADSDAVTGVLPDANVASTIARDSEVTAAVAAHEAAGDPHPGYLTSAEGDSAYVNVGGDTMTGGLLVTGSAALEAFRAMVTGETNDRVEILNDGRFRTVGSDAVVPTWGASTDPMWFLNHTRPGASGNGTGLRIRGSASTTITQPFAVEDNTGIPILWLMTAGGMRMTDALGIVNGVFTITEQAGFFFRNTNGSGAILNSNDAVSLVFGVSSQVWSGDPVPAAKTLGLNMGRSNWVFTGTTTSGSPTVTITAGLPSGKSIPVGSVVSATGVPAATTVTATTSTTITLSANATASGSVTVNCWEADTLAIRAYNGVEIHGNNGASGTAAGKIAYDQGLILSGDNDPNGTPSGWKISVTDKHFLPPTDNTNDIGTTSNRVRRAYAYNFRADTLVAPRTGVTGVNLGVSMDHFDTAYIDHVGTSSQPVTDLYVNDIQGTVTDGWVKASTTWTRVSDTQFTISSATDFTARFQKGTRLKWSNTTVKYGVVASSSFASSTTTVNLIATTDYTMTANPDSGTAYFSHVADPEGFPGWFAYTPTMTGFSVDPTTAIYRWSCVGRKMTVTVRQGVSGTSNATSLKISVPVQCNTSVTSGQWGAVWYIGTDNGTTLTTPGRVYINSATGPSSDGRGVQCDKDTAGAVWTASGGKRVAFTIEYEF